MALALEKIAPPKDLTYSDQEALFQFIFRRLAAYRNAAELHALAESQLITLPNEKKQRRKHEFSKVLNEWAQELVDKVDLMKKHNLCLHAKELQGLHGLWSTRRRYATTYRRQAQQP